MNSIISFCADGIVRDAISNNISAYNILETISSPGFPLFIQRIFFFCLLSRDEGESNDYELNLKVLNNDTEIMDIPVKAQFKNKPRNRQIVEIGGIAIPTSGNLTFILYHRGSVICSYSIEIKDISKPKVKNK